jgi:thioredoxin 1
MTEIVKIGSDEFRAIETSTGMRCVKFFSPTCVPCKMLDNVLKTLDDVGVSRVYAVDITKNPEIVIKYGVRGVPTVIVFNDGVETGRKVGFQKKEVLLEIINN